MDALPVLPLQTKAHFSSIPSVTATHDELIHAWFSALEFEVAGKRRAAETMKTYRSAILGRTGWLAYLRKNAIFAPTPTDVYAFITELRATCSAASCNCFLAAIRACYRWLELQGLYSALGRTVQPYRLSNRGPRASLEPPAIAHLCSLTPSRRPRFAALGAARDEALIRLIYGTGLRLISIARASIDDLCEDPNGHFLRHQPKGHDAKDDLVALPPNAVRSLKEYLALRVSAGDLSRPLFASMFPRPGMPLTTLSLRRIIYRYLDAAGYRERNARGDLLMPRTWGPHMLRRSAAVHAIDQLGLEAGQILLSHASADQTRRAYAGVKKYRVLQQLHDVMDLP